MTALQAYAMASRKVRLAAVAHANMTVPGGADDVKNGYGPRASAWLAAKDRFVLDRVRCG